MTTQAEADVAIEIRNVSHVYRGGTQALAGVSLKIRRGEFVSIIGQNGSGKSTLVKHLNGMLRPTNDGLVLISPAPGNVLDTRQTPVHRFAPHVGYAFQNPDRQIFQDTIADELRNSLRQIDVPEDEQVARITWMLELVGLADRADVNPFRLSRGQRQRVAIAAALVARPPIAVIDEPTTGQDRREATYLLEVLRQLNEDGMTLVLVSHDMALVGRYASRVIALSEGRVISDGSPATVFDDQDLLRTTNITPPQVTAFGLRVGIRGLMTPEQASQAVAARTGIVVDDLVEDGMHAPS